MAINAHVSNVASGPFFKKIVVVVTDGPSTTSIKTYFPSLIYISDTL